MKVLTTGTVVAAVGLVGCGRTSQRFYDPATTFRCLDTRPEADLRSIGLRKNYVVMQVARFTPPPGGAPRIGVIFNRWHGNDFASGALLEFFFEEGGARSFIENHSVRYQQVEKHGNVVFAWSDGANQSEFRRILLNCLRSKGS